jgi:calcium/calmodulin-dependent protein kinase I
MDIPIVRLKGIFETLEYFVLELELMQSADLFDRLSTEGVMSEAQAKSVSRQLVEAVALCSRINIAHRDIKLSNVVFPLPNSEATEEAREDFFKVKLADFGMAGFIGADGRLRGRCGTPGYVAPEILKAWQQEGYSPNVDMFSVSNHRLHLENSVLNRCLRTQVGVVTYTLLCGYEPFYGTTDKQLIQANKMAHYEFHMPEWAHVSSEAKDFVSAMMH